MVLPQLLVSDIIKARENGAVAGITGKGTSFSHAAIIAKAFGLPVMRVNETDRLGELTGSRLMVRPEEGDILILPETEETARTDKTATKTKEQVRSSLIREAPLSIWLNILDIDQSPPSGSTVYTVFIRKSSLTK